jgi:hypothetical protein
MYHRLLPRLMTRGCCRLGLGTSDAKPFADGDQVLCCANSLACGGRFYCLAAGADLRKARYKAELSWLIVGLRRAKGS